MPTDEIYQWSRLAGPLLLEVHRQGACRSQLRCRTAGLPAPSAKTIRRRLAGIRAEEVARLRQGPNSAAVRRLTTAAGQGPVSQRPLDIVQIDHTPVDIILVDETSRLPVGRPWLTVALDIYSRCITGFRPLPREALSSWLRRLAKAYDMGAGEFIEAALGIKRLDIGFVDYWPSAALIRKLAERTGVAVSRIRAMTMADYVPYFLDSFGPRTDLFSTYCCQFGVFENPALRVQTPPDAGWLPWLSGNLAAGKMIGCVYCLQNDQHRFGRLHWRANWMASCPEHGVLLQATSSAEPFEYPVPKEADEILVAFDTLILQAVTMGRVELPGGRIIHAGLWLRVLRGVIDEICRPRHMKNPVRPMVEAVWAVAGLPYRHALEDSGIFETLGCRERANVLKVAALAMRPLIRAGLKPLKASGSYSTIGVPRPVATSAFSRDFKSTPIKIETITLLAREIPEIAIDLRRMLNHQSRSARFVAQTDETLERLGIPVLAPLLVAEKPVSHAY